MTVYRIVRQFDVTRSVLDELVGYFEDLRRFNDLSVISRLESRR